MTRFAIGFIGLAVTAFFMSISVAHAETDVYKLDISGFKLGMTIEEARQISPELKIREIRPDGKTLIGYQGKVANMNLFFARDEMNNALFTIQYTRIYDEVPDPKPIYLSYVEQYGRPDYSGREMFHVHSCWGKCFGEHPKMEFRLMISSVMKSVYPMTLTLSDPGVDLKNRHFYLDESRAAKK